MTDDNPIDLDKHDVSDVEIVEGGELANMFLVKIDGETKPVKNTSTNKLLYKYGLYEFLYGGESERKILSEDPYIAVEPLDSDGKYRVWHGDSDLGVTVPPSKSENLLSGIVDALEHDDYSQVEAVYRDIFNNQVRRQVINPLSIMYPQSEVVPADEGWIIRGLFKVTWDANVYLVGKDLDEGDYRRGGGGVTQTDEPMEWLELEPQTVPEPKTIKINDNQYTLSELEMEFIAKVEYLLDFEETIGDEALLEIIKRQVRGDVRYADRPDKNDDSGVVYDA